MEIDNIKNIDDIEKYYMMALEKILKKYSNNTKYLMNIQKNVEVSK